MLAGNKYHLDAGAPGPVEGTNEAREAAALARTIQLDLEKVCLSAVAGLKDMTGATNLCFCGGVGLNSVLNGLLTRQLGFEQTYIPPYPGDDGISVGCCAFGLFSSEARAWGAAEGGGAPREKGAAKLWDKPLSPYQGPEYSKSEIEEAISAASPWLSVAEIESQEELVTSSAKTVAGWCRCRCRCDTKGMCVCVCVCRDTWIQAYISLPSPTLFHPLSHAHTYVDGNVVAWWQGRSEAGPRALGHRCTNKSPEPKPKARTQSTNPKHEP